MMSTSSQPLPLDHLSNDLTSEVSAPNLLGSDTDLNFLFSRPIPIGRRHTAKEVVSIPTPLSEIDLFSAHSQHAQYIPKVQKCVNSTQEEGSLDGDVSIHPPNFFAGIDGKNMMDQLSTSAISRSKNASSRHTPQFSTPLVFDEASMDSEVISSRDNRSEINQRVIHINNPEWTNERYDFAGNKVRTSKYTLLSFLPKNVFEQFHRIAYIYFLVIVFLNQIPQLAVFGRTASLFPLLFVLFVTAIKDGYEDLVRHRSDREENNRLSWVLQEGVFKPKKWKKIQVGEVIKLDANEPVPCDMVLLGTSDASGLAYIQTINLDGESNLKTRYARQETLIKNPEIDAIIGTIVCEPPNRNIYEFMAYMELDGARIPLGPNNIILRGCELKNTSWIVGVVVYAGRETKALLNSSKTHSKRSRLEQHMNKETLWLSFFLLVICFIGGGGAAIWVSRNDSQLDALPFFRKLDSQGEPYMFYGTLGAGVVGFFSFIIMFQIMIPISLYISLELVRLGQSYFMVRDTHMFDSGSDSRFQCRALNINEDLGQVKYVFSDKTGTLTENKMEFHSASVCGVNYFGISLVTDSVKSFEGANGIHETVVRGSHGWKPPVEARVDPKLVQILQSTSGIPEHKALHDYFLVLAACNTVVPTQVRVSPSGKVEMKVSTAMEGKMGTLQYQGESPDEQALVSAAASYGYVLLERTSSSIVIDVLGKLQRFKLLGVHEFDSVRKRMSVVVKCPDGTVKLLLKGADTSVLDILAKPKDSISISENGKSIPSEEGKKQKVLDATLAHLDLYAREGLRTLVLASKDLNCTELDVWSDEYAKASTSLVDRMGLLRNAANMVENQLTLLGATGIEDKLQAGVPATIASLRAAGIKVWVLTGDKQETAISIGFSCMLLTKDMHQIIINETSKDLCRKALQSARAQYGGFREMQLISEQDRALLDSTEHRQGSSRFSATFPSSKGVESEFNAEPNISSSSKQITSLALVIDGNSLVHALSQDLEDELFELSTLCEVVLCCRVAPLQKAGIVSLIKRKTNEMTLAIGDGANDVSMIQTAHVGVGISGQEGRQAVMASDFVMGQFRFLRRLLLVHGHWNYQRLAYMVLYNFYRNAVFVMMLFWYILNTAFSPSTALFDWNLVFYSLIYTSIPTVAVGILDKDVGHRTLIKYPQLYGVGQRNECYNSFLFWLTMLDTLWQSLVLFFVPFFMYQETTIDIWSMGSLWIAAVVVLVNLHLALDVQRWTWLTHLAIWGSLLATYACFFLLDSLPYESFLAHYWVIYHVTGTTYYWLNLLLIVVLALLPRFCIKVIEQRWWPSDVHIAREADILERNDRRKQFTMELNVLDHREPEVRPRYD